MAIFDYDADRDKNSTPPVLAYILVLILILSFMGMGGLFVFLGWQDVARGLASTGWPQATGVVQSSTVEREDSDGDAVQGNAARVKIVYAYTVRGQNYRASRFSFGDGVPDSDAIAEGLVSQYPVGQTVTVYYSPSDPAVAVLRPGASWSSWLPLLLGGAFFFAGLVCLIGLGRFVWPSRRPVEDTERAASGGPGDK